jgi:hypothetical protein
MDAGDQVVATDKNQLAVIAQTFFDSIQRPPHVSAVPMNYCTKSRAHSLDRLEPAHNVPMENERLLWNIGQEITAIGPDKSIFKGVNLDPLETFQQVELKLEISKVVLGVDVRGRSDRMRMLSDELDSLGLPGHVYAEHSGGRDWPVRIKLRKFVKKPQDRPKGVKVVASTILVRCGRNERLRTTLIGSRAQAHGQDVREEHGSPFIASSQVE